MYKKLMLAAVLLILFSLCACSDDSGAGKNLVFPIDESPTYLDPQIVSGNSGRLVVSNCFEGLVRLDENGQIAPAASEKWTVSDDGLTYTFNLRTGGKWYLSKSAKKFLGDEAEKFDTRVTADDFLFALQRAVMPATGSTYALSLGSIKNAEKIIAGRERVSALGVRAANDSTLVITLSAPDDDFLLALTTPIAMPCNRTFFNKTGGRYGVSSSYMIYNGPFYISSWSTTGSATIKKNPEFAGLYSVMPESVYFSLNSEQNTRLDKLISGTYDTAPMTKQQAEQITKDDKLTLYSFGDGIKALLFNCTDETVSNIKLRKALVSSLDVSLLSQGSATGIVPGACIAGGKNYRVAAGSIKAQQYNENTAKKLFEAALEELDVSTISISILCDSEDEVSVRTAMQTWQALFGLAIDVKCESVDNETLYSRIDNSQYSVAVAQIMSDSDFASDFMTRFVSTSAYNKVNLKDREYDYLMSKVINASTPSELVSSLYNAEQRLIDMAAVIPLDNVTKYFACADGVSSVVFSVTGELIYFAYAKRTD